MTEMSTKELYALFLQSDFWVQLSRIKRRIVGKCEHCGSKDDLQSHHVRYPAHWFDTGLGDLKVLCRMCHEKEHGISDVKFIPADKEQRQAFRKATKTAWKKNRKSKQFWKIVRKNRRRKKANGGHVPKFKALRCKPATHWVSRGTSSN